MMPCAAMVCPAASAVDSRMMCLCCAFFWRAAPSQSPATPAPMMTTSVCRCGMAVFCLLFLCEEVCGFAVAGGEDCFGEWLSLSWEGFFVAELFWECFRRGLESDDDAGEWCDALGDAEVFDPDFREDACALVDSESFCFCLEGEVGEGLAQVVTCVGVWVVVSGEVIDCACGDEHGC